MLLKNSFLLRDTNISAKVIKDSINECGNRITTFELEYPRYIHAEVMTHRALSKNSSSSRAIPLNKMLEQVQENTAIPNFWGKNKSGMQANGEVDDVSKALDVWLNSCCSAVESAKALGELGLHKQLANRVTEPFQMIKVVMSGTEYENFFNLRLHEDAQPEIVMLANKMYDAREKSVPCMLNSGEWHLPYIESDIDEEDDIFYYVWEQGASDSEVCDYNFKKQLSLKDAQTLSVACCAAVSYRTEGLTLEKAKKIYDMLVKAEVLHASPFEHLASPIHYLKYRNVGGGCDPQTWEEGVTHIRRDGALCSGNLVGFIQYRQTMKNNTCLSFDYGERIGDQ